ncbi:lysine biosynthesis protein LysX [Vulcanisaeta souniana]|uniref:Lysine biosynthesis enzyme LysX n=1 Tax=Vulcanisaeta souniana JCM 11219 TaxID=1293586 RepID=A0A830EEE6_9CREN|nr:lysine biosynthesis protein LysX [Vulcanisaeta souniana]BDR92329.1 lysine biosynthesis enzyme LysX [Vulcanisaeta souniana JCM 11219]GGI74753.1 lysine biosynthesis enzyme LysX [Vulcanisaeta souniana JCM 11219]
MVLIEAIHFLYDAIRLDEKLLIREFDNLGINYRLVNAEDLVFEIPGINDVGVAFIRTVSQSRTYLLSQMYEAMGGRSINPYLSIAIGNNKAVTLAVLNRVGVPIPNTVITLSSESAIKALGSVGVPAIIKPVHGSWGRLVSLVGSVEDLALLARHRSSMENPQYETYLVQEFIKKPGRDIRVTVVGDEAVAAIYRYAVSNDWRTNTARGGKAEGVRIDPELEDISVRATKAIGAYYAGVDVVESDGGYKILEVNTVPEFKNVQRVTGVNVARRVVELVIDVVKRG